MRFQIHFDPSLSFTSFETTLGLDQTVQDLELAISLHYNHLASSFLQYQGAPVISKTLILGDLIHSVVEPIPIYVRPRDQLQMANQTFNNIRDNLSNIKQEDVKKYSPFIIVLGIFLLIYIFS